MRRLTAFSSVTMLLTLPCLAQFQVSDHTARQVGLEVDVLSTTLPTASNFTINAPPGAPIVIYLDLLPIPDASYGYGAPLVAPSHIELASAIDITALVTGVPLFIMPASGIATFPIATPIVALPGQPWDIQAVMLAVDPASATGVSIGQCVRRTPSAIVGTAYGVGPVAIPGSFIDVEQGDVDGDGDLDTVLVTCNGTIQVYPTVQGVLRTAPLFSLPVGATSCELVDLDNDNYLDLVASLPNVGGGYTLNLGRPAPTPPNPALGAWLGFQPGLTPFPLTPGLGPSNGNDIETADIDLDGDRDVFIGCGLQPNGGEVNRLILNTTIPLAGGGPGVVTFLDVSGVQYPLNRNDTEDVEFFDMDGDGDDDIVEGNFDGGGATGVDYFAINLGIAQGGVTGFYSPLIAFPGAVNDETLDVVVGDINLDGAADVYVANWYSTQGATGGPPWGPPVIDRLYLTTGGVPFVFTDASRLLPDNPAYQGPTPVPPAPSVDAELCDYDLDGDLDIFVPIGRRCLTSAPLARGLNLLHNNILEAGLAGGTPPPFPIDPFGWIPPALVLDYSDIEMGDYQTIFHDQDFGVATLVTGFLSAIRN